MFKKFIYTIIITLIVPSIVNAQSKPKRDTSKDRSVILQQKRQTNNKSTFNVAKKKEQGTEGKTNNKKAKKQISGYKSNVQSHKEKIKSAYQDACSAGNKSALQAFISKYPNSEFVSDVKSRIEDYDMWQNAKSRNTIDSYRHYLNTSKKKIFAQLANESIKELESQEEWQKIVLSPSKAKIEAFISKYPQSSFKETANKRLSEYQGAEYYDKGLLQLAYNAFESAGGRNSLRYENRSKYDSCKEYMEYKRLNEYSKEVDLLSFLYRYPNSNYYKQVSNYVAIAKAKSLSWYSTSYRFNDALSYAKDRETRGIVKQYIDKVKHEAKLYKKNNRKAKIKENGRSVQFGIELVDMGFLDRFYYNMGCSVKFGHYKSPVQLEIGIKPGISMASSDSYLTYEIEDIESFFHMPVYAKLKLNICSAGRSKFYIDGFSTYNAIRNSEYDNEFSAGAGLGFAWKRWDYQLLYYKQDIANRINPNNLYFGTSLSVYF